MTQSPFQFDLGQLVWYLNKNTVHSAPVLSRMCIENKHEATTKENAEAFEPFGEPVVQYATIHGIWSKDKVFASKQDLLDSL